MKVLLKRFHLNGHTIGFRPQAQKLPLKPLKHLFKLKKEERKEFLEELTSKGYYEWWKLD